MISTKKAWVDEGGVRVPFFMRIPWMEKNGSVVEALSAHIDILPTLSDLCNLHLPAGLKLDGESRIPYLQNPSLHQPGRIIFTDQGLDNSIPCALRTEKFEITFGKDTSLYDLRKDPGQKVNIKSQQPALVDSFARLYHAWYQDVTAFGLEPIPILIGYPSHPEVSLPAHEALLSANLSFYEGHGWANDWIKNFKSYRDTISWKIEAVRDGRYRIRVLLATGPEHTGKNLEIHCGKSLTMASIEKIYKASAVTGPDRVKRQEAGERVWPELIFKDIELQRGPCDLSLCASDMNTDSGIEVKGIYIDYIKE